MSQGRGRCAQRTAGRGGLAFLGVLLGALLACQSRDGATGAASATASAAAPPATSAPTAEPTTPTVTFSRRAPQVGDRRTERTTNTMTLQGRVAVGGAGQALNMDEREEREVEVKVLAVENGIETAVEVTYRKATQSGLGARGGTDLVGKTFRVEAKGGKVVVTTPTGGALPAKVTEKVAEDHRSLGEPNPMEAALPTRPLRVGESLDSMSGALMAVLSRGQKAAPKLSDPRVTLERLEGSGAAQTAVIGFSVKAEFLQEGVMMTMQVKGAFTVRVSDSRLAATEMTAPIALSAAPGAPFAASGTGKLEVQSTLSYP